MDKVDSQSEESVSFYVYAKKNVSSEIKEILDELEAGLGVKSDVKVGKDRSIVATGVTVYLLLVSLEFAKGFAKKSGEAFADWLFQKLNLNKDKGEKIIESD